MTKWRQRGIGILIGAAMAIPAIAAAEDEQYKVAYCPSETSTEGGWAADGKDFKPSVPCPSGAIETSGGSSKTAPKERPDRRDEEVPAPPETLAEAQEILDPAEDPQVVLDEKADGTFGAWEVVTSEPVPDWVVTTDDLEAWTDQVNEGKQK